MLALHVKKMLLRDALIVCISLCAAGVLIATDAVSKILVGTNISHGVASFVAGIFFTSIFTTAPATAALAEIAAHNSILVTAFFGSLGSLLGDAFIFRFVRDNVSRDFGFIFNEIRHERRWLKMHHHWTELHAFKWLIPLLGAVMIASPLPDEIGLTILGLSKIKMRVMIPLTFVLNFIGILIIAEVGKMWL